MLACAASASSKEGKGLTVTSLPKSSKLHRDSLVTYVADVTIIDAQLSETGQRGVPESKHRQVSAVSCRSIADVYRARASCRPWVAHMCFRNPNMMSGAPLPEPYPGCPAGTFAGS